MPIYQYKNIVFDLGDVLFQPKHIYLAKYLKQKYNIEHEFSKLCWDKAYNEVKDFTSIMFWDKYTNLLQIPIAGNQLYMVWYNSNIPLEKNLELTKKLALKGLNLHYLTNTVKSIVEGRKPFLQHFKGGLGSFESVSNSRKPDINFYIEFLNMFNLKPSECIFIDDKPENIISAEQIGIKGIYFRDGVELENAIFELL